MLIITLIDKNSSLIIIIISIMFNTINMSAFPCLHSLDARSPAANHESKHWFSRCVFLFLSLLYIYILSHADWSQDFWYFIAPTIFNIFHEISGRKHCMILLGCTLLVLSSMLHCGCLSRAGMGKWQPAGRMRREGISCSPRRVSWIQLKRGPPTIIDYF